MGSPLLSIITINRNNAEGLRATMQSVLTQDFDDYEYIIIDGASNDGSVDVIRDFLAVSEYAAKISYWISEPDSGIYNAMNKGIRHAKGEFVNMMNSGDTMLPEVLWRVAKIAREHKGEILYGAINCTKNGEYISTAGVSAKMLTNNMVVHPSCFVPICVHEKFGMYDETYKITGDWDLFVHFYLENVSFFYMNMIVANFDTAGISSTSKAVQKENARVMKKNGLYKMMSPKQRVKLFLKNRFLSLKRFLRW